MSEYLDNYELDGWKITYNYREMKLRFIEKQRYSDEGFVLVDYSSYDLGWQYNPVSTMQLLLTEYSLLNYTRVAEIAQFLAGNITDDGFFL
jgi:hypothetical protein